ncbi:MAG: hypothetical protein MUQ30_10150 [Anaerolineae bacterium]|nr:hypothetical protein [Anaerolineae bacterium]
MGTLDKTQKIVLFILALLDVAVIGGMIAIVITSMRTPAQAPPAPTVAATTDALAATWTPTPTLTPRPTLLARLTNTARPTSTPMPTATSTSTPTPLPPAEIELSGADFDAIMPNRIPGWEWDAHVNYGPDSEYDSENSYAEPVFTTADDPLRQIDGATLKVETIRWLKFRTWIHQTVTVTAGSRAYFQIKAKAYSSLDGLIVRAGIDPAGAEHCYNARWGKEMRINQDSGTVRLSSPNVIVGPYQDPTVADEIEEGNEEAALGRVTLCFYAEPTFPHINNAAFFDQAELVVAPPR